VVSGELDVGEEVGGWIRGVVVANEERYVMQSTGINPRGGGGGVQ
jgi:hypothetical protein